MADKLMLILAGLAVILFLINLFYNGSSVRSCLLFILTLLPLMDIKLTPEAWGGIKVFDLISVYCLIFCIKDFLRTTQKERNHYYLFLFIALSIATLISGLASEFPEKTYINLLKTFPIFIFGRFFINECLRDPSFHAKAINAIKGSYIAALCFLAIQIAVGLKFTFYSSLNSNTYDADLNLTRYPGIFYDSQGHTQYLAMGSFLFLYVKEGLSRKIVLLNYLIFFLAIVGMTMAGGRAAFGGFAIGLFVVIVMAGKQYRIYGAIIAILGTIIYTMVLPHSGVFDRTENLSEDYLFRQNLWNKAFEIAKKNPYLGIGTENYQSYVMRHSQDQYLEVEDGQLMYFDQPENGYLKILVELGFIGFGIFMLLILTPLFKGFIYHIKGIFDKKVILIMAGLISWAVAFNTVYSLWDYRIMIMVASLMVLIIAYPKKEYLIYELAD